MSMSKTMLPTEGSEHSNRVDEFIDSNTIDEPHGMNLEEAVAEYIRLDGRWREIREEIAGVKEVLLPEAYEVRGQQNTARLSDHLGRTLKVEFKKDHKTDPDILNVAKELMGDDLFEKLFKTEYSPRLRELRMFLTSKSSDERIEQAKEEIRRGCVEIERAPYITIEKVK